MLTELFLDSLIPAPYLPYLRTFLDVGSGAGFPGLPLKIYRPQLETHLLEPNLKKVSFMKHIIRLTGLNSVKVIRGRVEDGPGRLNPKGYHLITARALTGLDQTVKWCAPLLRPGGFLVCYLGHKAEESIEKSHPVLKENGLALHIMIPYQLPEKDFKRNTVLFKKRLYETLMKNDYTRRT
jgi:16S rRNA (guanine527-N7)-methyltransferase